MKTNWMTKRVLSLMLGATLVIGSLLALTGCAGQSSAKGWSGPSDVKAPWKDYEEDVFALTASGKATNDMKFIVEKTQQDGKAVYRFENPLVLTDGEYTSGAVVDAETFKPLSSFYLRHPPEAYKDKKIDITGTYGDKLDLYAESAKGKQSWHLNLSGECVDNETVGMMVRCFPLAKDFKKTVNIAILSTAQVAPFEVRVTGTEKVKVPAGEYDCYKVEVQYKGLMPAAALQYWYTTDDTKLMVKSVQGATTFELKEVKYEKGTK